SLLVVVGFPGEGNLMEARAVGIASAVLPTSRTFITDKASPVLDLASVSRTAGMTGSAIQHIAEYVSRHDDVGAEGITFVNRGTSFDGAFRGDLQAQSNR